MLIKLVRAGSVGVASRSLLQEFYEASATVESARRLMGQDLLMLRQRGLVTTRPGIDRVTFVGVRNRKPPQWVLSREEHGAIFEARLRLRADAQVPYPVGEAGPLDRIFLLVRILEESGGVLDRAEAQRLTGWTWRQFQAAAAAVKEIFHAQSVFHVELEPLDDESDSDETAKVITGITLKREHDSDLRGTGTETLGVFPYSVQEVEERIELIQEALGALDGEDVVLLESALQKLRHWQQDLARHGQPLASS